MTAAETLAGIQARIAGDFARQTLVLARLVLGGSPAAAAAADPEQPSSRPQPAQAAGASGPARPGKAAREAAAAPAAKAAPPPPAPVRTPRLARKGDVAAPTNRLHRPTPRLSPAGDGLIAPPAADALMAASAGEALIAAPVPPLLRARLRKPRPTPDAPAAQDRPEAASRAAQKQLLPDRPTAASPPTAADMRARTRPAPQPARHAAAPETAAGRPQPRIDSVRPPSGHAAGRPRPIPPLPMAFPALSSMRLCWPAPRLAEERPWRLDQDQPSLADDPFAEDVLEAQLADLLEAGALAAGIDP